IATKALIRAFLIDPRSRRPRGILEAFAAEIGSRAPLPPSTVIPSRLLGRLARSLIRLTQDLAGAGQLPKERASKGAFHGYGPSSRRTAAIAAARAARLAACAGDVCGRRRGAADHWPRAQALARGHCVSDQRGPVRLRACDARAVRRLPGRRHQVA